MSFGKESLSVPASQLAGAAGLLLLVWVLLLYTAAYFHAPGIPQAKTAPLSPATSDWRAVMGEIAEQDGELTVAGFNDSGEAFLIWELDSIDAGDWPVLNLSVENFPLNYVLMLAWKTRIDGEDHFSRLQVPRGGRQTYLLSRLDDWTGRVGEVALYLHPQPQTSPPLALDHPITIRSVSLGPDSWPARGRALLTSWFAADPWEMMSPSSLGIYPDIDEGIRFTPMVFALFLATLVVAGQTLNLARATQWIRLGGVLLIVTVLAMQLRWMAGLADQRAASNALYAGLDDPQAALKLYDADLVELTLAARDVLPPPPQARVFIGADARFFRLRAGWHLRPHNVMTFLPGEDIGGVDQVRPGDYLFLYRRQDLMEQAREGRLRAGRLLASVDLLLDRGDGGLLRFVRPGD
ncbi:MAG: hypothetical protein QNJ40_01845 [Xanthomonadales bacterium]|nr:hypothetical protein [Xanthomonadales bacterium]